MSLRAIAAALGGEVYQNGARANVPAPGHSRHDRSVSLVVSGDRVIIHSFGAAEWQAVRDDLCARGLIAQDGRLIGGVGGAAAAARPDDASRRAVAARLWEGGVTPGPAGLVARYLASRGLAWPSHIADILEHPQAPVSVYRTGSRFRRAMMAGVRDDVGRLTAVELTYLEANGRLATGLRLPRKTIGRVPAGSAVRLGAIACRMLVAEGVVTTLSAMRRFELPGWALMSAGNLAHWRPPAEVASVLIAGDRGLAGERAAQRLQARLRRLGLDASIALPPPPWGDWNEAATAGRKDEGRSAAGTGERRWASRPAGETP